MTNDIQPNSEPSAGGSIKHMLAEVPCYNCGSTKRSGYLVVGDWLYVDVEHQVTKDDEVIEIETCGECGACQ